MYDLGVKSASDIKASPTRQSVLLSRLAADRDKEARTQRLFRSPDQGLRPVAFLRRCDGGGNRATDHVESGRKAHCSILESGQHLDIPHCENNRTDIARKEIHRAPNGHDFRLKDEVIRRNTVGRSQDVDIVRALDALPSDQPNVVRLSFEGFATATSLTGCIQLER